MTKRQLEIYECRTDDGVGLLIGHIMFVGVSERDLMRLLGQVFVGVGDKPPLIDPDLYELGQMYLNEETARERFEELKG